MLSASEPCPPSTIDLLHQFKEINGLEIGAHGANKSNSRHAGFSKMEEIQVILMSLEQLSDAFPDNDDGSRMWLTPGFSVTISTPNYFQILGSRCFLAFPRTMYHSSKQ